MYHIAICDDELHCLKKTAQLVNEVLEAEKIPYCIKEYTDGLSLLSDIKKGTEFQVLILDVMMSTINGIDLAAALRNQRDQTAIIFISYNREMALYGYEVAASRFLAKPIDKAKLREALLFCYQSVQEKKQSCCRRKKVSAGLFCLIFCMPKPGSVVQEWF